MALNKPGRCRRCGKPYTSTHHMKFCKGMSIKERRAARAHRAGIQRASRHRAGVIFTGSPANASYFEDAKRSALTPENSALSTVEAQS